MDSKIHISKFSEFFDLDECTHTNIHELLSKHKMPKIKEFCKVNKVKKTSGLSKKDLVNFLISKLEKPQELSAYEVSTDDDESASEDEDESCQEFWDFPEMDTDPEQLQSFLTTHRYGAVLIWSNECDPCIEYKPKFVKYIREKVFDNNIKIAGGMINVETYEENIESEEGAGPTDVEYLPTVKLCRDGIVFKTIPAPTIKQLEKNIEKMLTSKPSVSEMKEDLKRRGLSVAGKKDELYERIQQDNQDGSNYHLKSRDELISILTALKVRSKKHEEMESIALIKKIRKQLIKQEQMNEMDPNALRSRVGDVEDINSDHIKILKTMTVKQLRVLVQDGFPGASGSEPRFNCLGRKEGDVTIKASTKAQIIEQFQN